MVIMLIKLKWNVIIALVFAKRALLFKYAYHVIQTQIFPILIVQVVLVNVNLHTMLIVSLEFALNARLLVILAQLELLAYNVWMEMEYSQLIFICNLVYLSVLAIL